MRATFLLIALLLSFSTQAGLMKLEYWGVIEGGNESRIGDPIHGSMLIDTSLAPRDFSPEAPWITDKTNTGLYTWNTQEPGPRDPSPPGGFVWSDGMRNRSPIGSDDSVSVFDGFRPGESDRADVFSILDRELVPDGPNAFNSIELSIGLVAPVDFIHGKGLIQEFDVSPIPERSRGFLDRLGEQLIFGMHRATLKVCRP